LSVVRWLRSRFSRKLSLAVCLLLAAAMGAADLLLSRSLRRQFVDEVAEALFAQASLIGAQGPDLSRPSELKALAGRCAPACDCRVTFVRPDGTVAADSSLPLEALPSLENHKDRPEIRSALSGVPQTAVRRSGTLGRDMLYAAVPLRPSGAVRAAMSLEQVEKKVGGVRRTLLAITLFLMAAGILAALWTSRSISRPVAELSRVAGRLAGGDYEARFRSRVSDEHGRLGETLNLLAEKIQATIRDLSKEKTRLSAMLSNMVEAVVAVDPSGRVSEINPAAARLFSIRGEALGKPFLEAIRNDALDSLLKSVLRDNALKRGEVRVFRPEEAVFEAQAVPLTLEGRCAGALLVLHDITRLRRLEQVRKDFVANVSHELKTPLASIQAAAETLRLGAIEDASHRGEFVEGIEKDARRMARLVSDLLDLSSIESGRRPPEIEPVSLAGVAREAAEALATLAGPKGVSVEVRLPEGLPPVRADKGQLRQVLANLLDNAVKFNRQGGKVLVSARAGAGAVVVSVSDTGLGIPQDSLTRVFERFYRVDKARSRDLGGTGLGLAIVKHIVEAHGGTVSVESEPGRGSEFRFTWPAA
jgi:two-component system phosphate regulon sensor histidine kinase PhoR